MKVARSLRLMNRLVLALKFLTLSRKAGLTILWLALAMPFCTQAQKKVKLVHAEEMEGVKMEDGKTLTMFRHNVELQQNKTTIYCDSAYLYKETNSVEAFGHVKILEGDSVTTTGNHLDYDGNTRIAKLRGNVVFTKLETATLYTDYLDYDRSKQMAYYYNGGKLVDSINVLTSKKGYYDVTTNMASFKKDVVGKNPDYTMTSDSLQYNSRTKVVYFRTSTTVINDKNEKVVYEGGEYNTRTKNSDLLNGVVETPTYELVGDQYKLDDMRKFYKLRKNVVMTSKKENLIIYGQAVDYDKQTEITTVYDHPWLAKITDNNDTLFIAADTLISIDSEDPSKKRLLAYHNVRIFKTDMQGVADSLVYVAADSMINFYKDPVLWTQGNQMSGDSISMLIKENTINTIYLTHNAFVVSEDTIFNFNQIKGRDMTAKFLGGKIDRVLVDGNGESIYYMLEEKDLSLTGMNRIICSNMLIRFKLGRVDRISFYKQPDGRFVPPHELTAGEQRLPGFGWYKERRPEKHDVVPETRAVPENRIEYKPAIP